MNHGCFNCLNCQDKCKSLSPFLSIQCLDLDMYFVSHLANGHWLWANHCRMNWELGELTAILLHVLCTMFFNF